MNKSSLILVSVALFVVGSFVVFSSVTWGSAAANAYLRSQGGGMDGSQFLIVFQEYIVAFRWMGSILSAIGGLGFVKAIEVT
jgi:hypothetical protein